MEGLGKLILHIYSKLSEKITRGSCFMPLSQGFYLTIFSQNEVRNACSLSLLG